MLKKFKGIRLAWIQSFLIVIIIIMLLLVAFFVWIRIEVTDEAIVSNYNSSTFIKNIIDERLDTIQNLSYEIIYNDVSLKLLEAKTKDDFKTPQTYRFVNNIQNFVLSNNFVDDIYLYYPKYDYVIGKQGIYNSISYYLLQNSLSEKGYEKWLDSIKKSANMTYFTLKNGKDTDLLFSRYSASGAGSTDGCFLIAKVSKNSVNNILQWSNTQYPHQMVAITDQSNQLYTYDGEQELINLLSQAVKEKSLKVLSSNYYSYKDYFIISQPSKIKGLNYVLIKRRGNVLGIQSSVTNILIICILTCLMSGIILSIYMSNKNSKPLISLVQRMRTTVDAESLDEYEMISQKIETLFTENKTAIQQMEQQQRIIFTSFVRTMLSTEYRDETIINSITAMYGVDFENPYFCVLAVYFPTLETSNDDSVGVSIDEFCDNVGNNNFAIYHAFLQPYYVFIINYEAEEQEKEKVIRTFVESINKYASFAGLECSCVIGGVHSSACKISVSYQEAMLELESNHKKVVWLDTMHRHPAIHSELFYDFQRYLFTKEFQSAKKLLPELFEHYLANVEPVVANCRQSAVINQILEAVLHMESIKKFELQRESIRDILTSSSLAQCQERLTEVLEKLDELERPKEGNSDSTAFKIKAIIDHTYGNPMLGLSSISDELGVSNSYISRTFKEKYHSGIVEYINMVRIKHAKELIIEGDINMKAIAIRVGFSSDVSFIRVFKKYEKVTPGKYKQ